MKHLLALFAIITYLFQTPVAFSQNTHSKYYKISMTIEQNGKIIGTPTFISAPDSSAIMSNKAAGYSFKADIGTTGGVNNSSISIATELYFLKNDKWEIAGKPTVFVPIGKTSSISISKPGLDDFNISYKIEEVHTLANNVQIFGKNRCTASRIADWKKSLARPVSYLPSAKASASCCRFCDA